MYITLSQNLVKQLNRHSIRFGINPEEIIDQAIMNYLYGFAYTESPELTFGNLKLVYLPSKENEYRILIGESCDRIFSCYPDGNYRYANNPFTWGVGHSFDHIINRTVWEVFLKEEDSKRFAEENVKNNFDPHFTTKETSIGLGLSIFHSISKGILLN